MAKWVKLTWAGPPRESTIFVNLEFACTLMNRDDSGGARIAFVGGKKAYFDVKESAERILELAEGRPHA